MTQTAAQPGQGELDRTLKERFGHDQFRPLQQSIVEEVLAGRDVLTIMPTGGGKSLCYQLPAVLTEGLTLVVSPLIALMIDQVKAMQSNGIRAAYLNSSLDFDQVIQTEREAMTGQLDLLYMAPERLMGTHGQRLLRQLHISLLAVDEAHCISEWGHDFRPEYRMIGQLRQDPQLQLAQVPMIALTATATPRVAEDIAAQLQLREPEIYRRSFERQNLYYEVRPKQRVADQIVAYVNEHPQDEGIVYCHSRAATERLADKLQKAGINAKPYHAGLPHEERQANQHDFVYGQTQVMTATIAFGMGIDKPDVRFVIHADMPRHLEGYYQETGRAGRDGLDADCLLFFSAGDRAKIEHFFDEKSDEERKLAQWQLNQMVQFSYATNCRCVPLLGYFGEAHAGNCGHCDNCRMPPEQVDATEDAQKTLSAVARVEQRFGIGYVIDLLRGKANERSERYGHESLRIFGIGKSAPAAYWRRLIDALLCDGYLVQSSDEYPVLCLTESSLSLLRGEQTYQIVKPRALKQIKSTKASRGGRTSASEIEGMDVDEAMFHELRTLRRELAEKQGIAAYMVFSDVSLRHMASVKPSTLDEFSQINGVGAKKREQYGPTFIEKITELM